MRIEKEGYNMNYDEYNHKYKKLHDYYMEFGINLTEEILEKMYGDTIYFVNGSSITPINSTTNKKSKRAKVKTVSEQTPEQRINQLKQLIDKSLDEHNKADFEKYSKELSYLKSEFMIK